MMTRPQTISIRPPLRLKPAIPRRRIRRHRRYPRMVQLSRIIQLRRRQMPQIPLRHHGTPLNRHVDRIPVDKRTGCLIGTHAQMRHWRRAGDSITSVHGRAAGVERRGRCTTAGREVRYLGHGGGFGGCSGGGLLAGAHDAVPVEEACYEGDSGYGADDDAGDAASG